jgi:hypothetical protein
MDTTVGTDDIKNILGPNEKVAIFVKEKIYHPQINIDSLVVTNERIILRQPHALGSKTDFTDIRYSDIESVGLDKGKRRSTIKLTFKHKGDPLELGLLPTSLAEEAYGFIRANVNLLHEPALENAESSQAGPAPSEVDDKEVQKGIAPEEEAVTEGEATPFVAVEEAIPSAEAIPKRNSARRRSVPTNKVNSSAEEVAQDIAPAQEATEVHAPEEEAAVEAETSEEPEEVADTPTKETVVSTVPSTGDGWIEINGTRYEHDVIVHTDGSVSKRDKSLSKAKKAKYGHTPLTGKEVKILLKESPDMIIIGTGQTGALPITP